MAIRREKNLGDILSLRGRFKPLFFNPMAELGEPVAH
jgi:hypothetical protein